MALIKAGTYRFNDELTEAALWLRGDFYINENMDGMPVTVFFNAIYNVSTTNYFSLCYANWYTDSGWDMNVGKTNICGISGEVLLSVDSLQVHDTSHGWRLGVGIGSNTQMTDYYDVGKTVTVLKDIDVPDVDQHKWFTTNTRRVEEGASTTKITYNGSTIASLFSGQTATLKCEDLWMESDVVIETAEVSGGSAEPVLQEKTATENGEVTPDEGYDGLSKVTVAVESSGGASIDGGYTVTFMSEGSMWAMNCITSGQVVQRPTSPSKDGAYFNGWYTGENGEGEKISFPYMPEGDVTLYAKFSAATVVGVTGMMNEEGSLTLTDDIAGMEGYEEIQNGDYVSITSKLSDTFPFCDLEEITDDSGNVFVKFPKLWMKWETDDSDRITGYKFANYQADEDFFIPDAFLDPNYVTTDTYLDYFALGKYEMSGSTSKGYSVSGASCLVDVTRANARSAARAYGSSSNLYNGYQLLDFAQLTLYNLLCMMFFQTANIQKVYGGRTGSGTVTSWSAASVTGTTDGVDGLNGWNVATDCVKMLGIENPYGNIFKWVDGVYFSGTTIYAHRFPQQYTDGSPNATALGFGRPDSSSYITALKKGTADKTRSFAYAAEVGGSASQYCGDCCYYSSTGVVLYAGGDWCDGGFAGLWFLRGNSSASVSYSNIGARLSFRPL